MKYRHSPIGLVNDLEEVPGRSSALLKAKVDQAIPVMANLLGLLVITAAEAPRLEVPSLVGHRCTEGSGLGRAHYGVIHGMTGCRIKGGVPVGQAARLIRVNVGYICKGK